jgi:hypothetical protein
MGIIPQASAAAAAASPGRIVRVKRFPEHLVIGLRTGAELRCVGLADRDGTGLFQPFNDQAIFQRYEVLENRRALRCADSFCRGQVFVGYRQTVQGPNCFASGKRIVGGPRLLQRLLGQERNNGIYLRVNPLDLFQVSFHYLGGR